MIPGAQCCNCTENEIDAQRREVGVCGHQTLAGRLGAPLGSWGLAARKIENNLPQPLAHLKSESQNVAARVMCLHQRNGVCLKGSVTGR
jgi:hypothetical protein